jgi:hypothetical protein
MGFDPVSLTIGAMVVGGAIKGGGEIFGGMQKADMYRYQAAYAQKKAEIDQQNANYELAVGEIKATTGALRNRQIAGQERVGYGAGNIRVDTPGSSVQDVLASTRLAGQFDEATTRANAARAAFGYEAAASEQEVQSEIYKRSATTSEVAGITQGAGTIISSAAGVSDKWIQFSQAGIGPGSPGASNLWSTST